MMENCLKKDPIHIIRLVVLIMVLVIIMSTTPTHHHMGGVEQIPEAAYANQHAKHVKQAQLRVVDQMHIVKHLLVLLVKVLVTKY